MTLQATLFPDIDTQTASLMPEGFRYQQELISVEEEMLLASQIAALPLTPYEFRGFLANRNVFAFGFRYDYKMRSLIKAPDIPPFLQKIREKIAAFANREPEDFRQVLVTEYKSGTALAWHRDRLQYDEIVGISLLSPANFRLRRRQEDGWLRASQIIAPRSAYIMAGEVRMLWEHSIPAVEAPRYSLTFRTMAGNFVSPAVK
ncbi:alpha-ketoglutarate-dependent dioxygenase AlkB [Undibacterium sp. TJN25]|uniref:alpha-ketoglutarate-dependent dioxygenase AlkB n=1 Tax=Undibacterium sp. TJN25 TaxID=3413056 RepID=UPI003BF42B1E